MSQDYSNMKGLLYECAKCGELTAGEEIEMRGRISCIHCGYRVLKKIRPPIVKRVKAV